MKRICSALLVFAVLACAESTSPRYQAPSLRIAAALTLAAPEVVLPAGYDTVMGTINNNFPHASFRNMRYQQVFLGDALVDPVIVGLCLRRDEAATSLAREKILTVKLGPTSFDHTNLGTSFDGNYSAPPTLVFSDTVVVPASIGDGTPADFDFCIPFTQAYEHPAGSNLIVEVVNTSVNLSDAPRDACVSTEAQCTTARAYALSPTAATATTLERRGLIMKFVSPIPPAPLDPVSHGECLKGGWSNFDFRNQGQCIRFVETGLDSRVPESGA